MVGGVNDVWGDVFLVNLRGIGIGYIFILFNGRCFVLYLGM